MGGSSSTISQKEERISAMRIQSSAYGKAIPIVWGKTRIAGNLIWYGDFLAIAHTNVQDSGGKGGGGVRQENTTYTYQTAVAIGLCEGPIPGIGTIWSGKTKFTPTELNAEVFTGTYPQSPWGYLTTFHSSTLTITNEMHSLAPGNYTVTIDRPPLATSISVVDMFGRTMVEVGGAPLSGEYSRSGSTYTFSTQDVDPGVIVIAGNFQMAITYTIANPDAREDLNYNGLAYFAIAGYDLGNHAELPNHTVEIKGRFPVSAGTIDDANPKDILSDALTNVNYGALFPSGSIGDLTLYQTYCAATGLFLSPALTEQMPCSQFIQDLMDATNSGLVWSESLLKIVPRGEESVGSYVPNVTAVYDLTDDDFLYDESSGEPPVQVMRVPQPDAFNHVQIEFIDASNEYNIAIAEAKDQANIEQYGLRTEEPQRIHWITNVETARFVAQLRLQRVLYIRNSYKFSTGHKFALVEPMDILTLTDSGLGLSFFPVRVTEVEEAQDGGISFVAEEFPFGVAHSPAHLQQAGTGFAADFNITPASISVPQLFEPPSRITETGLEIWAAISNMDVNYGGCNVWISSDDATYKRVGRLAGESRMGITTSSLPLVADPDDTSVLGVNLSQSEGTLLGGTQDDADQFHTLCFVDGEMISYRDATLTSAFHYNLQHLRRGVYGTTDAVHASGTRFIRVDAGILKIPYTKEQIGQQIFLKFTAFNTYGGGAQALADVGAYTYNIIGPTAPENVTNFSARQVGNVVSFDWDRLSDPAVTGYDIGFGPLGTTDWGTMTPLTVESKGTEMTNASVPPGDWTFGIRAHNIADKLSPLVTTFDLTVVSNADVIVQVQQAPTWPGTRTNLVKHWTGVLFPDQPGTVDLSNFDWCDIFIANPFPTWEYEAPEINIGFDDTARVYGKIDAHLGPGVTTGIAAQQLLVDFRKAADAYDGFENWTVGFVTAKFFKFKFSGSAAVGIPVITGFLPTVDQDEQTEVFKNVVIAAGGTAITFPIPYHNIPAVIGQIVATDGRTVSITNVTTTGFTAHVFLSGSDVGGTINYSVTGV